MLQVLAAVVWVALFHSLLFFLGRVVADPCGKTDFAASIIFGLLWLPGFCLSLRLPWLLLLQLLPRPSRPTRRPKPRHRPRRRRRRTAAQLKVDMPLCWNVTTQKWRN